MALFVYGTLRHKPLLATLLGRDPDTLDLTPARLPGWRARAVAGHDFPVLVPGEGAAEGLLFEPDAEARARLDFYEGGYAYGCRRLDVETADGPVTADVYVPEPGRWPEAGDWSLDDWAERWGDVMRFVAEEVMERRAAGQTPEQVARVFTAIRARAWIRARLVQPAPTALRSAAHPAEITGFGQGFDGFFRLRTFTMRQARFDGGAAAEISRECFVSFDAALILPYDPASDCVLLVEQMRIGALIRNDPHPILLEPVAGLIDAGESPAEAAVREAMEESGITIRAVEPIAGVYASPGYNTDYFHCFLGLADLAGADKRLGGAPEEHEDIRSHVLPLDDALALIDSGEINVAPLAMMLLWLARHRERLRGSA
ncbi:tellurite resistance protein [Oceanicola granulosus HTCC2516]|uniref:ADP-ribose pyrophosphatase n=1 Tax=Oceanicola granulosus (strain ATCC BAA-861 / DSM 15982 / KCTC 12143 / HTCC2516) TaxID=314256 RepID=Q2CFF4_OCEGH|nr:gamma-glutamylcyclotransferase [Oceanicola granulosus]EAR51341.1 tellurite resistance protein [Oceanicola granulosus HTCC2516]